MTALFPKVLTAQEMSDEFALNEVVRPRVYDAARLVAALVEATKNSSTEEVIRLITPLVRDVELMGMVVGSMAKLIATSEVQSAR
jgi:hypothetical protein